MDDNNKIEEGELVSKIGEAADNIEEAAEEIIPAAEEIAEAVSEATEAPAAAVPVQTEAPTAEITYAPATIKAAKKKKKKETKPAKLSAVIAICLAAILLCGAAGFGGSLIANRIYSNKTGADRSAPTQSDSPLVIYRDASDAPVVSSADGSDGLTYVEVAAAVKDSVVEINTEFTTRSAWFQYVNGGAGSGVIITEDGYIVTNAHVVMNEDSTSLADTITVRLPDGKEFDATVKGYDSDADIAVIKIEAVGLTPAVCGNSDNLAVGEELIVVGNPLGELGGSVTKGIVSATEREIEVSGNKMTLIQTDAAVNPGNSGGGMFNMAGQLVGIVNAKSSGTDIEGLGFAIPANKVLEVTEQLMEYGYVRGKVTIGVTFRTVSNGSFAGYYNIKPGVYVDSLVKGMNDEVLEVGDRIIAVNGEEITSGSEIVSKVSECAVGDTLTFQFYREGKLTEGTVTCFEVLPDTEYDIEFGEDKEENDGYDPHGDDGYYYSPFDGFEDFFGDFFGW